MDASPFAKLSPELRNIIYELCCHHGEIRIDKERANPQAAMTRVCQQIRKESLLLSYSIPQAYIIRVPVTEDINAPCFESSWFRVRDKQCFEQISSVKIQCPETAFLPRYRDAWYRFYQGLLDAGLAFDRIVIDSDTAETASVRKYIQNGTRRPAMGPYVTAMLATRDGLRDLLLRDIEDVFAARTESEGAIAAILNERALGNGVVM
ncbi:hypothetical protein LTR78_003560 [Recurvomyces mirabilis]|uniref:Uncharacterized protein n=1 Tax=Recurvomyces mirabilis TaxID=574656 RepID=A0AAE0WS25_9PEZI|nr:hypothetical protein LTR78_003560 [Recurvomyces mirabilis]KAK5154409.1 hypothetical protein LTS14_006544 [Recurvomyces mirabilis]